MNFARAKITRDISIPGPTKSQQNRQAKQTTFYKFEEGISFAEQWKLVSESSEFHLMLKRAHRVHFFNSKYAKKAGLLSEKRDGAKKA